MKDTIVVGDQSGRLWEANPIPCPVCKGDNYRELFKLVKSKCNPKRPEDTFVKCSNCSFVYINPRIIFPVDPIKMQDLSRSELSAAEDVRISDYELLEDLERIRKFQAYR